MYEIKEFFTSNLFTTKLLPSLLGLLGGVVGSIITPWIKWEIEKKKETREIKRKKIDSWRFYIENHFNWDSFRDTSIFSYFDFSAETFDFLPSSSSSLSLSLSFLFPFGPASKSSLFFPASPSAFYQFPGSRL